MGTQTETAAGPTVTLEDVKAALTRVAEHNLLGTERANTIACKSGDAQGKGRDWDSIRPKHFPRVVEKCKQALKEAEKEAEAERQAQARLDAVDVVGKQITELANNFKKEAAAEAKAKGEAKDHGEKAESFFKQLTEKLKEALPLAAAAEMTTSNLKDKYVGDRLGWTQFKKALRIAKGKTTPEEVTEQERIAKAARRAARKEAKAANAAAERSGQPNVPTTSEQAPRASGPAEISEEEAKARMAALDGDSQPAADAAHVEDGPSLAPSDPTPHTLTPEEISDEALVKFKAMVGELCPSMTAHDLGQARVYLTEEKRWRPRQKAHAKAA
jgi:hypothetical protein